MIELGNGIDTYLPDATVDLDGTVFKLTVVEEYTNWLCSEHIFRGMPAEILMAKQVWKENNTEQNYKTHLGLLVRFFVEQIQDKSVKLLSEAAEEVARQQMHRRWNIITAIMQELEDTHNLIAVSLMPEWLMKPFTDNLGFVALIGSTYVEHEGAYTGEAQTIDKATAYKAVRHGDTEALDLHIGDTMGDATLFGLARRPILFNPSWTLYDQMQGTGLTVITSHKDLVTVINRGEAKDETSVSVWGPPIDAKAILAEVHVR